MPEIDRQSRVYGVTNQNELFIWDKDGKLYSIPPSLSIYVMFGSPDVIQGRKKWGLAEFAQLYKNLKKKQYVIDFDFSDLLSDLLCPNLDLFVDFQHAKADFKQELFDLIMKCAQNTQNPYESQPEIEQARKNHGEQGKPLFKRKE